MKRKKVRQLLAIMICGSMFLGGCKNLSGLESGDASSENQEAAADESGTAEETATESTLKVTADMADFKDDDVYTEWKNGTYTEITLDGDTAKAGGNGSGTTIKNGVITIHQGGTYVFSGTLDDGQIVVEAGDSEDVRIVLDGVSVTCADGPAIVCTEADKVIVSLEGGTENTLVDGSSYSSEKYTAAIYSKTGLVFNGTGSLIVEANYNNGIQSKDDLRILEGNFTINSVDDALVGKDKVAIKDGMFDINSGGDGIKSTNAEDEEKGFIYIGNGIFDIESGADGIQAKTGMLIEDGAFSIVADGGAANAVAQNGMMNGGMGQNRKREGTARGVAVLATGNDLKGGRVKNLAIDKSSEAASQDRTAEEKTGSKGIKAAGCLDITGGTFVIDASDDTLHTNYAMTIDGGDFTLTAGDDAVHGDVQLVLNDGKFLITECVEGLESADLIINGGEYDITASDDAINGAGGEKDASETMRQMPGGGKMPEGMELPEGMEMPEGMKLPEGGKMPEGMELPEDGKLPEGMELPEGGKMPEGMELPENGNMPQRGQMPGGANMGMFSTSSGNLTITGGYIVARADGDGIDVNGSVTMTGGTVIVEGPTNDGNAALDYDNTFVVDGGTLIAVGSSGMMQTISSESQLPFITAVFDKQQGEQTVTLKDASGNVIMEYTPSRVYESFIFASADLTEGETYQVYAGDTLLTAVTAE